MKKQPFKKNQPKSGEYFFSNESIEKLEPLNFTSDSSLNQFKIKTIDGKVIMTKQQWQQLNRY